jgi:pimeloyl-ACP methyl ester carboxylesterase
VIAYSRFGGGTPVVCLHGWPGSSADYAQALPLLERDADVIVPDLVGFGASFAPDDVSRPPGDFGRDAQAGAVLELMDALDLAPAVLVGYDVGSTTAIALARRAPERVRALVLGNPGHPGSLHHAFDVDQRGEFWYQDFHQLALAEQLIDGSPTAVRAYLQHTWGRWGARAVARVDGVTDQLVASYARPGAFTVSLNWYRSGSATVAMALAAAGTEPPPPVSTSTTVLWGEQDPLFTPRFSENLGVTFSSYELHRLPDVGHFVPLEAAVEVAEAVRARL